MVVRFQKDTVCCMPQMIGVTREFMFEGTHIFWTGRRHHSNMLTRGLTIIRRNYRSVYREKEQYYIIGG